VSVTGVVLEFDAARGDGWLRGDDGVRYYLHCVELTDGTRLIDPGVRVSFDIRRGLLGADEARRISRI
jgi:cold shock CspA family protein